jgi:hypothetical protein
MSALILGLLFTAFYNLGRVDTAYDPLYAGESLGEAGCLSKDLHPQIWGLLHQTGDPKETRTPALEWGTSKSLPLQTPISPEGSVVPPQEAGDPQTQGLCLPIRTGPLLLHQSRRMRLGWVS